MKTGKREIFQGLIAAFAERHHVVQCEPHILPAFARVAVFTQVFGTIADLVSEFGGELRLRAHFLPRLSVSGCATADW